MSEPRWLSKRGVLAMHTKQLALHGGPPGLRDEGLLESAWARPQHLFTHGEPGLADLAAAYAYGLARNHPFIDGNKRTSFIAAGAFLIRNGATFDAETADTVRCPRLPSRLGFGQRFTPGSRKVNFVVIDRRHRLSSSQVGDSPSR